MSAASFARALPRSNAQTAVPTGAAGSSPAPAMNKAR